MSIGFETFPFFGWYRIQYGNNLVQKKFCSDFWYRHTLIQCLSARGSHHPAVAPGRRWGWLMVIGALMQIASTANNPQNLQPDLRISKNKTLCPVLLVCTLVYWASIYLVGDEPASNIFFAHLRCANRFDLPKNSDRLSFHFSSWSMPHCIKCIWSKWVNKHLNPLLLKNVKNAACWTDTGCWKDTGSNFFALTTDQQ